MPAIQSGSELSKQLGTARELISMVQNGLTDAVQLQRTLEAKSVSPSTLVSTLTPFYADLEALAREAARTILTCFFEPALSYGVGTPAAYTTNVIVASSIGDAAVTDKITADAAAFGGLLPGDTIEVLDAENVANKTLFPVDDLVTVSMLPTGFLLPTANAADTALAFELRGRAPEFAQDATKVAILDITTNAGGSGSANFTSKDGVLVGFAFDAGTIDEYNYVVVSRHPVCTISQIDKVNDVQITTVEPHGLVTGDMVRFEAIDDDAVYEELNGHSFRVTVINTTIFKCVGFDASGAAANLTTDQGLVFRVNDPESLQVFHRGSSDTDTGLVLKPGMRLRPSDTCYLGLTSDDPSKACVLTGMLV